MLQLYILTTTICFFLLLPVVVLIGLSRKKYRGRTMQRLGFGLSGLVKKGRKNGKPTIWIHALSVGEVTSALPLLKGLRNRYPEARIYLSTTTRSGYETAAHRTELLVDGLFFSPFDWIFSVDRFIHTIRPSLFLLVETDFWPCWLARMRKNHIPCILVNGRMSESSLKTYKRFSLLFRPMFDCFTLLCMQTRHDARALISLGLAADKILTPGNLKYDAMLINAHHEPEPAARSSLGFSPNAPLLVCGSTHRGEEEVIFAACVRIRQHYPEFSLLLAPRDIGRTEEILKIAEKYRLSMRQRSRDASRPGTILLLDTLGELALCYQLADFALIGGSLVNEGGHNPLEAAACAVPLLFGPHMEDFAEISRDLLAVNGAEEVHDADSLASILLQWLEHPERAGETGRAAKQVVDANTGVAGRHLELIQQQLS